MNKDNLLERLTVLDFLATDLALYLNTHPNDNEAIERYNAVISEADNLRYLYEENVGPLYSFRSPSDNKYFGWINEPWPQDYCFNFDINGISNSACSKG